MTMARRLPGNSVQHGITRDPTTTSHYMPEDPQCCVRKWYFTRQEIDDHSPSRRDNIELSSESHLRKLYCSFLKDLGKTLKVPQVTIATAIMFCHRFYMRQSHARNDWQIIATVSMFLACKVEESPCALRDVVIVAYELMYRWDPSAPRRIRQSERYNKQKELISVGERLLLATMAFDFNIEHPYKPLVAALKRLKISHNDLAKVAWNFVNDWLCTTLCLQYKPHYIAAGSLFLAAKFNKVKLPTEKGNVWWLEFDISPKQLEEVIQEMLRLLEQNKEQTSRCGKVSESIAGGGKATSHSAQSGITSASAAAPHSSYGATVESGVLTKSAVLSKCSQGTACGKAISHSTQSGITCVSAAAPHSSYGTTVESGVLDKSVALSKSSQSMACGKAISQTAQSGISSGSVAAPHSSYEATVESRVLGNVVSSKCSQSTTCGKAISQSAQSGISSGSVAAQHSSYGAMVESGVLDKSVASSKCSVSMACGKAMPHSTQSGISSGSVAAQHASHETTVESDVVGKSAASSKCTQNMACGDDGHVSENGILQSQASDCGSANSVVEDGDGDIRPKTVESAQNLGFGIVSVHGGRSQIDVNRIREKMKKRQLDKAASMKLVNAMDDSTDNTAWIERELENGIKVESTTPADKKRRRVL